MRNIVYNIYLVIVVLVIGGFFLGLFYIFLFSVNVFICLWCLLKRDNKNVVLVKNIFG